MLSIWWCVKGEIYWELLSENITVINIRYCAQQNKLESEVVKQGLSSDKIYILYDNPKPYVVKFAKEKIVNFGWELLSHPPYLPDLLPLKLVKQSFKVENF